MTLTLSATSKNENAASVLSVPSSNPTVRSMVGFAADDSIFT